MPLNVSLFIPTLPTPPFPSFLAHRYELTDELSGLFELRLLFSSSDPGIDFGTVVGERASLDFLDEPFLTAPPPSSPGAVRPTLDGIVRAARQLGSTAQASANVAPMYELVIQPFKWRHTRIRDARIFTGKSAADIADAVMGVAHPRSLAASPPRAYCVQYNETNYDFVRRILAEEGITALPAGKDDDVYWKLVDDTTQGAIDHGISVAAADSNLPQNQPTITNVIVAEAMETSTVTSRAYDYARVNLGNVDTQARAQAPLLANEGQLELFDYQPYAVGDPRRAADADRLLAALRAPARTFVFETNFALRAGSLFTVQNHSRADVNGQAFVVVRTRGVVDDAGAAASAGTGTATHLLECIPRGVPYLPRRLPRPLIHGTQTATVHGVPQPNRLPLAASDALARVSLVFPWARRGEIAPSVRVSQAWAGGRFGVFAMPRIGDEVLVSYLDGDPDQPVVVGRVHNSLKVPTKSPADPREMTISAWRGQSDDALGKDPNEILMDDALLQQRLELHAQRDFRSVTEHDSVTVVRHDGFLTVEHDETDVIKRAYSMQAGSVTVACGPYLLMADTIEEQAKRRALYQSGGPMTIEAAADLTMDAGGKALLQAASVTVSANSITLAAGGCSITLGAGGISLTSAEGIVLVAGSDTTITAGGNLTVTAGGEAAVTAPLIKLN